MITLQETKQRMISDPPNWVIALMDFVDDFRYYKDPSALAAPVSYTDQRLDPILASTAEYLCDEQGIDCPSWLANIPACPTPWFVSGLENLKAIALVESPLRFRIWKIFVLANFLSRV